LVFRAVIPAASIKPLDTPAKILALKRTNGFNNAMKEIERHQELLAAPPPLGGAETDGGDQSTGDNDMDDEQVSVRRWGEGGVVGVGGTGPRPPDLGAGDRLGDQCFVVNDIVDEQMRESGGGVGGCWG